MKTMKTEKAMTMMKKRMKKVLERMKMFLICHHPGLLNCLLIRISLLIYALMERKLYSIRNAKLTSTLNALKLMV
jgi:hypothetical protein